jgi:hypothetical protein
MDASNIGAKGNRPILTRIMRRCSGQGLVLFVLLREEIEEVEDAALFEKMVELVLKISRRSHQPS